MHFDFSDKGRWSRGSVRGRVLGHNGNCFCNREGHGQRVDCCFSDGGISHSEEGNLRSCLDGNRSCISII